MADREFDIVIFGATGDAGRAMVTLLAESAPPGLRWTVAGRSATKLEDIRNKARQMRLAAMFAKGELRSALTVQRWWLQLQARAEEQKGVQQPSPAKQKLARAKSWSPASCQSISVANCADDAALRALAARTRVLISAAGPYSLLGERVLLACIEAQTQYADITGEVPWVAEMRRRHHARAVAAGVCIASFCGYDCVPAELSLYLGRQALAAPLTFAESVLLPADDGGAPRGTLLTTLTLMHQVPSMVRGLLDFVPRQQRWPMLASLVSALLPSWSGHVRAFTLPHFMFWCNTPVVHASAACTEGSVALRYRDAMMLPLCDRWFTLWGLLPLAVVYACLALLAPPAWALLALPPVKRAAQRALGSYSYGGSRAARTAFRTRVLAAPPAGAKGAASAATIALALPGDGGIYATATLALACGLAMLDVLDGAAGFGGERGRLRAGMCTPVEALGDALVARLRAVPGVTMEVEVEPAKEE